uniref:Cytochrome P450 n=1 Tax=Glossina palpalis gambiensis TaxID=67801 RepID=A0A1B0B047_9MUSC
MIFLITCWLLLSVIALIYIFLTWNYNFWKNRGVTGPKPTLIFGNLPSAITRKRNIMYDIWEIYEDANYFVGIYNNRNPVLLILKPELAREVYVTNFKHFHDNEMSRTIDERIDFLFANNPFIATGSKWKERRTELTGGLTAARIKAMFPVTLKTCKHLVCYVQEEIKVASTQGIDAKNLCSRFTADIITDCVMGLESDSFSKTVSPLMGMQDHMFEVRSFHKVIDHFLPKLNKWLKHRFITEKFEHYFHELMENSINLRKSDDKLSTRIDFLNYLLELQAKKNLDLREISAHAMTFLLDGFETTASVLAHTLLMLARYPAKQQKLREEILKSLGETEVFEIVSGLDYLNACIHETLRFFPVVFFMSKRCTQPFEMVNKNGQSLVVPKDLTVIVPHYHIMMDDSVYENAYEYQPERFLLENGGVRKYMDMGAYWGYGDGPRICPGVRFGFIQIKTALIEILRQFSVQVNPKTRSDYKFDEYYFPRLDGGVWLDFQSFHWRKRDIKGPKPKIIFGNFSNPMKQKRHMSYELQEIYESYKCTENIVGVYAMRTPRLLVISAELVHRIFVNDFKHFHDNEMPTAIKSVFPITEKVCATMLQFIEKQMQMGPKDGINASDLTLRFSSEVVTDCVLGLSANSFSDQPLEAMNKVKKLFDQSFYFLLPILLSNFLPSLRKFLKTGFLSKDSEQYFTDLIGKAIDLRKSGREEGANESRIDFLDYLLRLQEKKNLSTSRVIAYTMSFLVDGFETTGSTMAHCLLLLGRDAERQEQLRNEIKEKLGSSNDFDIINSLPYLDACIHETLRLFPPAFFSNKVCTEAIAYSNKNSHSINIEKGDVVVLPLHAIMSDEDYYDNPHLFEPERFLEENGGLKKYKDMGVYYGFGDGPRSCLGMRFALAQIKTGLVNIVRRFKIKVNPKTRADNKYDLNYMLTRLDGGIWLEFENF